MYVCHIELLVIKGRKINLTTNNLILGKNLHTGCHNFLFGLSIFLPGQ